jgi:hypothetical protein
MNSRTSLTAIGCVLAAAVMVSCGGGGGGGGSKKPAVTARTTPPSVVVGSASMSGPPPSEQTKRDAGRSPFVRDVNLACARMIERQPVISSSLPILRMRADEVARDATWLRRLQKRLLRVRAPAPPGHGFQTYLVTLKNEILLDTLIARAARNGDRQAVAIGMAQNQRNRDRRTGIARKLRLSTCLRDSSSNG